MSNPLLEDLPLPAFGRIKPEDIEPAITALLDEHRALARALAKRSEPPTWESLMQPLEDKQDQLQRAWSPVSHLHSVADNEALRDAYNACLPKLTEHAAALGQDEDLWRACKALAASNEFAGLSVAQRKIIKNALRDFRLAGVELNQRDKERCKTLQKSALQTANPVRGKSA